jgi:hypothetical protein
MHQRVFIGLLNIVIIAFAVSCAPEGQAQSKSTGKFTSPVSAAGASPSAAGTAAGMATSGRGAPPTTTGSFGAAGSFSPAGSFSTAVSGTGAATAGSSAATSADSGSGGMGGRGSRRRN